MKRNLWIVTAALVLLMSTGPLAMADDSRCIELNNLGVADLNKGDFESATEKFESALKIDPAYSLARHNLSIAHGDLPGAAVEFEAALKLKDNPDVHRKLADVYRKLNAQAKAKMHDELAAKTSQEK